LRGCSIRSIQWNLQCQRRSQRTRWLAIVLAIPKTFIGFFLSL
jgi:hypothetical protein